jgi:hypothetical protein
MRLPRFNNLGDPTLSVALTVSFSFTGCVSVRPASLTHVLVLGGLAYIVRLVARTCDNCAVVLATLLEGLMRVKSGLRGLCGWRPSGHDPW